MGERVVILVGHGGIPRDFPRDDLMESKRLEGARRARGEATPSAREAELDRRLREWPRTAESDPYGAGLERIADALRARLGDTPVLSAYNEFCAPSVEQALLAAIDAGAAEIVVVPTMVTPGGSHSEIEIPEVIAAVRAARPGADIRYAWPFAPGRVAELLADQVLAFGSEARGEHS
ncbi:MAG: CbiX/SirB N-terminal domain-containing protein [Polyangiaceae bacterium]